MQIAKQLGQLAPARILSIFLAVTGLAMAQAIPPDAERGVDRAQRVASSR